MADKCEICGTTSVRLTACQLCYKSVCSNCRDEFVGVCANCVRELFLGVASVLGEGDCESCGGKGTKRLVIHRGGWIESKCKVCGSFSWEWEAVEMDYANQMLLENLAEIFRLSYQELFAALERAGGCYHAETEIERMLSNTGDDEYGSDYENYIARIERRYYDTPNPRKDNLDKGEKAVSQALYSKGMNLSDYLAEYDYFEEFTQYVFEVIAKGINARKYLKRGDLVLIFVWKNLWRERLWSISVEADEEKIRNTTKRIFEIDHGNRDDIISLLTDLSKLYLLGGTLPLKTASVILAVVFPENYGVFDFRIKEALGMNKEDEESCVEAFFKMREIAKEQESLTGRHWTARMVDQALWKLHRLKKG